MAKKAAKNAAKAAKPKAPPKPRGGKKAAPQASGSVGGDNVVKMDPKMRELARHHRDTYRKLKERAGKLSKDMRLFGEEVKGDGLTMRQIKLMLELETPEGEAAFRANIANDLVAAQWQGASVGSQLSLFLEPDRTPSADIAFDEGIQDSIDGKTANPKYAPSVPQHAAYMRGYHEETERRIKDGIGSDVKPNPTRAETLAAARDKNAAPAEVETKH